MGSANASAVPSLTPGYRAEVAFVEAQKSWQCMPHSNKIFLNPHELFLSFPQIPLLTQLPLSHGQI